MFTLFLFSSVLAIAQEKPACDAKGITRDCAFFEEKNSQPIIPFGDKQYLLNPRYERRMSYRKINLGPTQSNGQPLQMPNGPSADSLNPVDQEKGFERHLRNQGDLQEKLDGTALSPYVRVFLSQWSPGLALQPNRQVRIPWPLNQKDATVQMKSGEEIFAEIKKLIGVERYNDFMKEVQKQKEPLEAQLQASEDQERARYQAEQEQKAKREVSTHQRSQRNQKIRQLFEDAKKDVIRIVTRGKPRESWTPEDEIMEAKIQSLVFKGPDDQALQSSSCTGNKRNAFYSADGTVNLCAAFQDEHDAFLVAILSHEIAHSVDPCNSLMPSWKINQKKIKEMLSQPNLDGKSKEDLTNLAADKAEIIHLDLDLVLEDPSTKEKLIAAGAIEKIRDGIPAEKYPLKREYQCLVEKNNFKEVNSADIDDAKKYLESRLAESTEPTKLKKIVDRYARALEKYPQCLQTATHMSQMGETMSDVVGALNAEKHLLESPPKSETERVAAMGFSYDACKKNKFPEAPSLASKKLFDIYADEHPQAETRIAKVFLNLPGMAEIYGCKREHQSCFDHLSDYRPGNSNTKTPSPNEKTGVSK